MDQSGDETDQKATHETGDVPDRCPLGHYRGRRLLRRRPRPAYGLCPPGRERFGRGRLWVVPVLLRQARYGGRRSGTVCPFRCQGHFSSPLRLITSLFSTTRLCWSPHPPYHDGEGHTDGSGGGFCPQSEVGFGGPWLRRRALRFWPPSFGAGGVKVSGPKALRQIGHARPPMFPARSPGRH